jgi:hypothetical protein
MKDEIIAVVDNTFDPEETDSPFGKRWGGEIFKLSKDHLTALRAGKILALDVMGEYVTFVALEKSGDGK